ncbi:hypothetical protein ACJX0J_032824, partial [Zea mays]
MDEIEPQHMYSIQYQVSMSTSTFAFPYIVITKTWAAHTFGLEFEHVGIFHYKIYLQCGHFQSNAYNILFYRNPWLILNWYGPIGPGMPIITTRRTSYVFLLCYMDIILQRCNTFTMFIYWLGSSQQVAIAELAKVLENYLLSNALHIYVAVPTCAGTLIISLLSLDVLYADYSKIIVDTLIHAISCCYIKTTGWALMYKSLKGLQVHKKKIL